MNDSNLRFIRNLFFRFNLWICLWRNGWMVVPNNRFNEAFLRAVDFAFDSLGKSCEQALYFHLKNSFNIKQNDLSEKVEEFDEALSLIFREGVVYLKRLVLRKLCEDLGVKFEVNYVSDFARAVLKLKSIVSEDEHLVTVISGFDEKGTLVKRRKGGETVGSES
jgi:hypothetical protein